jgi:hypothetical protein
MKKIIHTILGALFLGGGCPLYGVEHLDFIEEEVLKAIPEMLNKIPDGLKALKNIPLAQELEEDVVQAVSSLLDKIPNTFHTLKSLPLTLKRKEELKNLVSSKEKIAEFLKGILFVVEHKAEEIIKEGAEEIVSSKPFRGKLKDIKDGSKDFILAFPSILKNKLKGVKKKIKSALLKIKRIQLVNKGGWKNNIKSASKELAMDFKDMGKNVKDMYKEGKRGKFSNLHTYVICTLQDVGKAQLDFGNLVGNVSHLKLTKRIISLHIEKLVRGQNLFFLKSWQDLIKGGREIKEHKYREGLRDMGKSVVDSATGAGILGSEVMNFIGTGLSFTPAGSLPPLIVKQVFSLMGQTDILVKAGGISLKNAKDAIKVLVNHQSPKIALVKMIQSGRGALAVVTIIGANVIPIVIPVLVPLAQDSIGTVGTKIGEALIREISQLANSRAIRKIKAVKSTSSSEPHVPSPVEAA